MSENQDITIHCYGFHRENTEACMAVAGMKVKFLSNREDRVLQLLVERQLHPQLRTTCSALYLQSRAY